MMKHTKATHQRSRDPTDVYYKRLIDMMHDHGITLKTAILWDFDGFMPNPTLGTILTPEEELDYYLYINYLPDEKRMFFTGVALGYLPDYGIGDAEKSKQKDAGSSSSS